MPRCARSLTPMAVGLPCPLTQEHPACGVGAQTLVACDHSCALAPVTAIFGDLGWSSAI